MTEHLEMRLSKAYEDHAEELFRFAFYKVDTKDLAEDLVAEAFLQLWQKMQHEDIGNHRALLYTILRGRIIDHYRSRGRRINLTLEDAEDVVFEDSTEERLDEALDHARVLKHVHMLKDEYAEIILLHYVQDLSFSELSIILNETENNLRVRAHRALTKLKKKLS